MNSQFFKWIENCCQWCRRKPDEPIERIDRYGHRWIVEKQGTDCWQWNSSIPVVTENGQEWMMHMREFMFKTRDEALKDAIEWGMPCP